MGIDTQVTLLFAQILLFALISRIRCESSTMNFVDMQGGFYVDSGRGLYPPGMMGTVLAGRKRARPLSQGFMIKI
jgi:hypothetical protein